MAIYAAPEYRIRIRAKTEDSAITKRKEKQRESRPLLYTVEAAPNPESDAHDVSEDGGGLENVADNTYVIYRCNRWGRFERWSEKSRARGRGGGRVWPQDVASWWGPIVLDGNVEQTGMSSLHDVCPVDMAESMETRRCVEALPLHLRETIWQEHVRPARTQREKSETLGIKRRTFRHRLGVAYPLLLGFMNDVAAGLEPGHTDAKPEDSE